MAKAREAGLKTIALTDHDSVAGIAEAVAAGKEYGVEVIAGVELSLTYQKYSGIHLLGYYLDWENPRLNQALIELRQVRARRGEIIVGKINQMLTQEGKPLLDIYELRKIAKGSVGRPHISQMILGKGYAKDTSEAFKRYLVPCNVPKKKLSPREGVELVNTARGLAVLAHPTILTDERRGVSKQDQLKLIHYMLAQGIDGLEAIYSGYQQPLIDSYLELVVKHKLVVTAGSDFHREEGDVKLGCLGANLSLPADIVERLRDKYQEKYGDFPLPD